MAFFLPWASLIPLHDKIDPETFAQALATRESDLWSDYIFMPHAMWEHTVSRPEEGLSAYQIAFASNRSSPAGKIQHILEKDIWGESHSERGGGAQADLSSLWLGLRILLIFPISALLAMLLLMASSANRMLLLLCGAAQVGLYGVARWILTQILSVGHDLWLKLGFWLCIYSVLILGIMCLIRWFRSYQGSGKSPAGRKR